MQVIKKFTIEAVISNPTDSSKQRTMHMDVTVTKEEGNYYGNGYYMSIEGDIEELFDLRYTPDFSASIAPSYVVDYINQKWSGENGAWLVYSITIK